MGWSRWSPLKTHSLQHHWVRCRATNGRVWRTGLSNGYSLAGRLMALFQPMYIKQGEPRCSLKRRAFFGRCHTELRAVRVRFLMDLFKFQVSHASCLMLMICMWSPKRLKNNSAYTLTLFEGLHFIILKFRNTKRSRLVQYMLPELFGTPNGWIHKQWYHIASFQLVTKTGRAFPMDISVKTTAVMPQTPGQWWELGKTMEKHHQFKRFAHSILTKLSGWDDHMVHLVHHQLGLDREITSRTCHRSSPLVWCYWSCWRCAMFRKLMRVM